MDSEQILGQEPEQSPESDAPELPEGEDTGELETLRAEVERLRTELEAVRRRQEAAENSNKRNALMSAGPVSGSAGEYFTPDEVRAMSRTEVRANYKKIIESMKKWN